MSGGVEFPAGFVRYVLTPSMPFVAGFVDLKLDWAHTTERQTFIAGQDVSVLPSPLIRLLPPLEQQAIQHKFTQERFWLANAVIRQLWEDDYDGPTPSECAEATSAQGAFLSIRATSVCLVETDGVCCSSLPYAPTDSSSLPSSSPASAAPPDAQSSIHLPPPVQPPPESSASAAPTHPVPSQPPPSVLPRLPPSYPASRPPLLTPPSSSPPLAPSQPPELTRCDHVAGRLELAAEHGCYELDDSHSEVASTHADCAQYYMDMGQGKVKLCYWSLGQCKATQPFQCAAEFVDSLALVAMNPHVVASAASSTKDSTPAGAVMKEEAGFSIRYCAGHTGLVQLGAFAEEATLHALDFLRENAASW